MKLCKKKCVPHFSCHFRNSVCYSLLTETDFNYTHKCMTMKYSSVPLSHSYMVSRSHHCEINVIKSLRITLNGSSDAHFLQQSEESEEQTDFSHKTG